MPITKSGATFFDRELKPESLQDVLNVTAQEWIERLRKSLQDNDRVSTSRLQDSLIPSIQINPSFVSFQIKGEKYWKVVNDGRKPGAKAPPASAMKDFIRNRAIIPKDGKTPAAYASLAFMLGQSIKKKGIKPTHFVDEAISSDEITKLKKEIKKAAKAGLL